MLQTLGISLGATFAGCLVLVGLTGAAVYFFMRQREAAQRQRESEERAVAFQKMQSVITEEIKAVRELVTVKKNFKAELSFSEDKKISWLDVRLPGGSRKFQMSYEGRISCGCDLDSIRFERDEITNRVKIIVPPSEILDAYADVNSFKIHFQDAGIFADNIKIEEQNKWIAENLEKQKQHAVQEGILTLADEKVRQMLTKILANHSLCEGFEVEIIFKGNNGTKVINAPRQNLLR